MQPYETADVNMSMILLGMFDGGNPTDESMEFLLSNHDWMVEQSSLYWQTSEYWRTVRGMLSQLTGIVSGANEGKHLFRYC